MLNAHKKIAYVYRKLDTNTQTLLPRERLLKYGSPSLTDQELLAIILGSGGKDDPIQKLSARIISEFNGIHNLCNCEPQQLLNIKYIGPAKCLCIIAVCELAKRIGLSTGNSNEKIEGPTDIFNQVRKDFFSKEKECFVLISLDSGFRVISKDTLFVGTHNESLVSTRELFIQAVRRNAVFIALAHNHPSGNTLPSEEDITTTKAIAEAGRVIGIKLIDHIIVAGNEYASLRALSAYSNLFEKSN